MLSMEDTVIFMDNLCAGLFLGVRSRSDCIRYQRDLRVPSGVYEMKISCPWIA